MNFMKKFLFLIILLGMNGCSNDSKINHSKINGIIIDDGFIGLGDNRNFSAPTNGIPYKYENKTNENYIRIEIK